MNKQPRFDDFRLFRQLNPRVLWALLSVALLSRDLPAADESAIKPLVAEMLAADETYDPQPLLQHGAAGMRVVLAELFPELAELPENPTKRIAVLVEQLGDENFSRREAAMDALRRFGTIAEGPVRAALNHSDAEIRSRARKLVEEQKKTRSEPPQKYLGLRAYLAKLEDAESQQELARGAAKALEARLDLTPKQVVLQHCLAGLTPRRSDRVHGELIPLLERDDPAPAIFAMRHIGKRNDDVSPLHMAALACGRPELIKAGIRAIDGPVYDQANRPKIRAVLEPMFGESPEYDVFRKDLDFMMTAAFYAARDYRIPQARQWLIDMMSKGNEKEAVRAIQALGDTGYMRTKLDKDLLAALEPHLSSKNARFRQAAIYTIGVYQGAAVQPALLKALEDPERQVWKEAAERLLDQHRFYPRGQSPIPKLLEEALPTSSEPKHRARLEYMVKFFQQDNPQFYRWPEEQVKPEQVKPAEKPK